MKKCMIVPVFLLLLIVGVFAVTVVATDIPETHSDSEAKTVTVTLYNNTSFQVFETK